MRRRILTSILAVVILTTLVLGLPLMYGAWFWVERNNQHDMKLRLERIAAEIRAQEHQGSVPGPLDTDSIRLLVPEDGKLTAIYPTTDDGGGRLNIGVDTVAHPITETLTTGSGSVTLQINSSNLRIEQERAVVGVALIALASMAAGTAVAVITAQRLAGPWKDVANRAARLSQGDFRRDPRRHAIFELDRVSEALDNAAVEIAGRLKREHALVADVSHQLRSRLTAIRLRLDELSVHSDPDVVAEAEAAMAQVDRLTDTIDELLRASRADASSSKSVVAVAEELTDVVTEWLPQFAGRGRAIRLVGDRSLKAPITEARLREAVTVLIDNALVHGAGVCTVRVRRSSSRMDSGAMMVRVDVSDEGPGVSNELAPHIFDRGFSGAGSTGVGLALARALIEADGGRLQLQRRRPPLFTIFLGGEAPPPVPPRREPR